MRWIRLLLIAATFAACAGMLNVAQAEERRPIFLPILNRGGLAQPVFGVQSNSLSRPTVLSQAKLLSPAWVRIQGLSWRQVQPERSAEIDWRAANEFERHVLAANEAGFTPAIVVWDSPSWATINKPKATSCGAIREDRFADFAEFMSAAVERYSQPPFNVHYWELGNEPDVDPHLPSTNAAWGCWGDAQDYWYGGEHYGRMLNTVAPMIRAADANAKIVFGGLLLDRPNTVTTNVGKAEHFFEGALRANAGASFDILAFHAYAGYAGYYTDTDLNTLNIWSSQLGRLRDKAAFLRKVMGRYGVNKPLWANEIGLICFYCAEAEDDPPPGFLETQADMLPRLFARAMSVGVQQVAWYMLEDSNWLLSSLMGEDDTARPAFQAYSEFIRRVGNGPVAVDVVGDYGPNVEAYRFSTNSGTFDLAWSNSYRTYVVQMPIAGFNGAFTRDGTSLDTTMTGGQMHITIGFSPVYIVRNGQ